MSEPQPQPKPRTRKVTTRSRNGCWTCRARRKKCDEKRPFCTPCEPIPVHPKDVPGGKNEQSASSSAAQPARISTGNAGGVKQKSPRGSPTANIGSLSECMGVLNFSVPPTQTRTSSPSPKVKSEKSTAAAAAAAASSSPVERSPSVATSNSLVTAIPLSPFDEEIFEEFKEWGSQYLAEAGQSPFGDILAFCSESRSLIANCLMFQLTLHPEHEDKFEEYYAKSLRLFREDMNRCMKWTIHLNGLYSIIRYRNTLSAPSHISSEILDSIGFFDLPTHVLGRATKPLNIWRDYCRGKSGIEPNSNIPFSLIDLLSLVGQTGVEMQLWTWQWNDGGNESSGRNAHPPSLLTRLAWDATRLAGIISSREYKLLNHVEITDLSASDPYKSPQSENDGCPPTPFLVEAILSNLTTILTTDSSQQPQQPYSQDRQHQQPSQEACEVLNLLLYPAFVAGNQPTLLTPQHKQRIEVFWQELFPDMGADGPGTPHIQVPLDILRDLWRDARGRTADMIAKERGVEIGLF
ncbi:conserved hypothetical protein [Microsporum canis CBS 113480]|uniref:Zn(2)-C6 fungal-type domain-containing protein n=1 Tax=Arthroderma otae (strain ATCC MYA-4605 / CBS 113480) TaxID=554155 RepID=C5FV46_ARTOC|nr:conserved hypothetical protein [Microsporum canis CBS 113480]EEQ33780.1 conserved hypothetical protein [Microsporum canis CBS 113480]